MANKTQQTNASVAEFVSSLSEKRKADAQRLVAWMQELTGQPPKMWGKSIIGFGAYQYAYASGREGEWFRIGFSPRKAALTLYIMPGFENLSDELAALGNPKQGKSCLYFKHLPTSEAGEEHVKTLLKRSLKLMDDAYPT